jgi:predicted negative regulator of RcsB-dependent stress response
LTDYLTEQEQIELFKNWLKQYSLVIIAGIALAIFAATGWRYWQQRQATILDRASSVYNEMLTLRTQNEPSAGLVQAQKLLTHYPQTVYAQMAAFILARNAILKNDYPEAEKKFNWIIEHSHVASIRQIARIRLARIMIADNKPKKAIETLTTIEDKYFNGLTDEIRGDAYLKMKDRIKARESYQTALTELPNAESIRPLLQMKYENLTTINP